MYSPFKKSDGRRFSAEAAMPIPGGRLMLPDLCGPLIPQGRDMQTVISKQFSTSSQSVRKFSGGTLLHEENLLSTKSNFFADSLCGHRNASERKTSCYNDESHTASRTATLSRGPNRDKAQLVTTGVRERHKSGQEKTYTTKDDNTTQSTDQFQTSTQDEFCFANEIPKEFGRIKLNDEDFMEKPKFNFFHQFKSPQPRQSLEIHAAPVPKKNFSFFTGKPHFTKMGCVRSKEKKQVKQPEKVESHEEKVETTEEDKDLLKMREDCLKAHNEYRSKHESPPLKLREDLIEMAQKWADHLASIRTLQHSECRMGEEFVGENIAYKWMSTGGEFTGQEVTDNWYSEISKYDYAVGRSPGTGHFTQVVWKSSLELGVGKAKASDGSFYVVANYFPAGNIIGRFEENVLPQL